MNPLTQLIGAVDGARRDPAMKDATEAAFTLDYKDWLAIAASARIALAALRKVQRVGAPRNGGERTEESHIALKALYRINRKGETR